MTATHYGPKRFIAGAVCPRCAQMDKIVMYRIKETEQVRECVRCDFREVMADEPPTAAEEPETRVNRPRLGEEPLPHEDEVSVVRLIDPRDDTEGKE